MNIILIYFAIKYKGDWDAIYKALDHKERVPLAEITALEKKIKDEKWQVMTILDLDYPQQLKMAYKPPFVLWFKGNREVFGNEFITVTGNQVTDQVDEWVKTFVPEVEKSHNIVATAFKGVDETISARSAKPRLIVIPGGIESGVHTFAKPDDLLISEYPSDAHPTRDSFRNSNRIVAAFGKSLVLFSSKRNGGINNLVSHFLNLGKDIYCFPGNEKGDDGNSELIKQGASLITSIQDISSEVC